MHGCIWLKEVKAEKSALAVCTQEHNMFSSPLLLIPPLFFPFHGYSHPFQLSMLARPTIHPASKARPKRKRKSTANKNLTHHSARSRETNSVSSAFP